MKILIAYYSHSANTKKLAELIGKVLKSEFQNVPENCVGYNCRDWIYCHDKSDLENRRLS